MDFNEYKKGFRRGYQQLTLAQEKEAKEKLWEALGIVSRSSFGHYLHGRVEPKVAQAAAVEKVFEEYGITDIWGECDTAE